MGKDFSPFKVKERLIIAKKKKKKKGVKFFKGKELFVKTIFMPLCLLDVVKSNDDDDKFFIGA